MLSRLQKGRTGFTLLEMAIVIVASGMLLSLGITLYRNYLSNRYANESYDNLRLVDSSLALFINANGRLPCPSNPTLPVTDPLAGRSLDDSGPTPSNPLGGPCYQLREQSTAAGTCIDGVCRVDGRDTDADLETTRGDPVLIGGLPFRDIRDSGSTSSASQVESLDSWAFQFTYAVSGYLTDRDKYRASRGAIDVRTEPTPSATAGIPLVEPAGSSQYVIVAHGKNHLGAYTASGQIPFPCVAGATRDADNCDGDASFTAGLLKEVSSNEYFDDVVIYNSYSLSMLWDFVGSSADIYNRNPGFVGIGTGVPTQQLEVAGDIKTTTLRATNLCDKATGANCWSPDLLAAPASSGLSLYCPNTGTPGMADVVVGIGLDTSIPPKPKAVCGLVPKVTPATGTTCPAGQFVLGFSASGAPQCGTP